MHRFTTSSFLSRRGFRSRAVAVSVVAAAIAMGLMLSHSQRAFASGSCTGWFAYPSAAATQCGTGQQPSPIPGTSTQSPAAAATQAGSAATSTSLEAESVDAIASTYGSNDLGCSGWYTGSAHPDMTCRASADSAAGYPIVLRNGTWNGTSGFGWSKAYYYHNLWTKPIVDTIAYGLISGTPSNKDYEVIHYTNGEIDQYVIVVADTTSTSWGGISTQDGREVGVLTGYCQNAAGATEPECPGWVDDTL